MTIQICTCGYPVTDNGSHCQPADERDGQLALLRERNAQLLAENTKLQRLVNTQKLVIAGLQIQAVELLRERR